MRSRKVINGVKWGQMGSTYAEAAAVAPTIAGISFISLVFLKIFLRKLEENETVPSLYLDGKINRNKSFGRFSSSEVSSKSSNVIIVRLNKG